MNLVLTPTFEKKINVCARAVFFSFFLQAKLKTNLTKISIIWQIFLRIF